MFNISKVDSILYIIILHNTNEIYARTLVGTMDSLLNIAPMIESEI